MYTHWAMYLGRYRLTGDVMRESQLHSPGERAFHPTRAEMPKVRVRSRVTLTETCPVPCGLNQGTY